MTDDGRRTSRALAPGAWEQGAWLWHAAFYGLLLASTLSALLTGGLDTKPRLALLGLALAMGVLYRLLAVPYPLGVEQLVPSLALVAGAIGLWSLLVGLHPAFYLMLFVLYPMIFSRLRLSVAIPVALLLNALTVLREVLDSGRPLTDDWSPVSSGLLSAGLGIAFAVWITRIIHQSVERRRLIDQLQATRQAVHQRSDRQDPPHPHLRQARGGRPHGGGGGRAGARYHPITRPNPLNQSIRI